MSLFGCYELLGFSRFSGKSAVTHSKMAKCALVGIRHLQIMAGMERDKYVVVYWILITKIKEILKKKVPQIATGSF